MIPHRKPKMGELFKYTVEQRELSGLHWRLAVAPSTLTPEMRARIRELEERERLQRQRGDA